MSYRSGLAALLLSSLIAMPVMAQDEEAEGGEEASSEEESSGFMGGVTDGIGNAFGAVGGFFGGLLPDAQPFEGRPFYFSGMGSYLITDKDRGADSGFGVTLSLGKRMTDGLALELTGHYLTADAESKPGLADNGSAQLKGFGVTAMIFPFDGAPGFYGLLSVGPSGTENHPGAVASYKGTYFDTGFGLLYPFSPSLLLRAEARYHMDADGQEKSGLQPNNNKEFYDGLINVGVLMPLGTAVPPPAPAPEPAPEGPLDSDNDGVPDDLDKCPGTTAGAVVNEEGCETDADGDGVPDSLDKCPDSPAGTAVGPDGCALDSDGDGVPDALDECPKSPAGAKVLASGCALQGDCRTPRAGEQVDENGCAVEKTFILRGVNFEFDSDRLTEEAKQILVQVAQTLQAYADVLVEIAGHTDNLGTDAYNLGLSERRSIAVKTFLSGQGVEPTRMTPVGYGEAQPIDTNDTSEGQAKNRRVELRVKDEGAAPAAAPASTPVSGAAEPSDPGTPAEDVPADAPVDDAAAPADEPAADDAAAEEPALDEETL